MWALLLLIGVILFINWFEYRQCVDEYVFAQPTSMDKIRDVIREKTLLVAEIGSLPWREEVASVANWNVATAGEDDGGANLFLPISEWLRESPRPAFFNQADLAEEMGLSKGLVEIQDARPWWWLPGFYNQRVSILEKESVAGLEWVDAERRWIGCSGGASIVLWLVHSGNRRYLPGSEKQADPWSLTAAETPWIGRVQYIEVRVRPGWCIAIPAQWGVAIRPEGAESWIWSVEQHSAYSWSLASAKEKVRALGEIDYTGAEKENE
jgi:hypothetical protein